MSNHSVRPGGVIELPARALLGSVRFAVARRLLLSGIGLTLVLVLGVGYLLFGTLQVNPFESTMVVRVMLAQSGGLLPNQDVTLRGVPIGRIRSVELTAGGVVAEASIDAGVQIPKDAPVTVSSLSPAGEQYLDFRPTSSGGPYLSDGATISQDKSSTPVTLTQVLSSANGTVLQVSPEKVKSIVTELGAGPEAPKKLAAILDGGSFLVSTLDSVLPQTVSLINNSKVVLNTVSDFGPGIANASQNFSTTLRGVEPMTGGFRTLIAQGPPIWKSIDSIIADNSPTMVQLLGNLTTTAQMAYLHVPALREFFFPQQRDGSALAAINSAIHGGQVWAIANIYPRYVCDRNTPRDPVTDASYPEPYLYTTCQNPDPTILPRGARNAPRPPGEPVPGAVPPGADPLARTDPAPKGPLSIPTPEGGGFVQ